MLGLLSLIPVQLNSCHYALSIRYLLVKGLGFDLELTQGLLVEKYLNRYSPDDMGVQNEVPSTLKMLWENGISKAELVLRCIKRWRKDL